MRWSVLKVTTKEKLLLSCKSSGMPRESVRAKSMREMSLLGSVEYRWGRYRDSLWKSPGAVLPRETFAIVPRVLGTGPMVSRNPASVSETKNALFTVRGRITGPTV